MYAYKAKIAIMIPTATHPAIDAYIPYECALFILADGDESLIAASAYTIKPEMTAIVMKSTIIMTIIAVLGIFNIEMINKRKYTLCVITCM
jgi:hypothetical protein